MKTRVTKYLSSILRPDALKTRWSLLKECGNFNNFLNIKTQTQVHINLEQLNLTYATVLPDLINIFLKSIFQCFPWSKKQLFFKQ